MITSALPGYLQVEAWHPCPHLPGCITVNVGDSLQLWSDGVLKSNYHRVRMPEPGEPQVLLNAQAVSGQLHHRHPMY
jgi:hypothetical protein